MTLETTENGVPYNWWLSGPDGARFHLHPIKGQHTEKKVLEAKQELKRDRDVLGMIHVTWEDKG